MERPPGIGHLERLEHVRDLAARTSRYDTASTRLALFSGAGFNDRLRAQAADRDDILLVGLSDLYGKS